MPSFPILKTGAVAQYPLASRIQFSTQEVLFLNGSRQVFTLKAPLRSWTVRLDRLDQGEMAAVAAFVEATLGATFAFTDPVSGDTSEKCILRGNVAVFQMDEEVRGRLDLTIEEVL